MSWRRWTSALLFALALSGGAAGEVFRVATWNIENFWHIPGESLRGPYKGRDQVRSVDDYAALRATIARLDAHVWALQEMGSPDAARALFPADEWQLVFSARYSPENPRDIYTALAVRRGIVVHETAQIPLNVGNTKRQATAARLDWDGQDMWVASVHLKAGCRNDDLPSSDRDACAIMAQQLPILEAWVDARLDGALIVAGDFNRTLMGQTRYQPGDDPAWEDLSDSDPAPLFAFPFAPSVNCPEGRFRDRTWPVDFILTSPALAARAGNGPYFRSMGGEGLSDHCPVVLELG